MNYIASYTEMALHYFTLQNEIQTEKLSNPLYGQCLAFSLVEPVIFVGCADVFVLFTFFFFYITVLFHEDYQN